MPVIKDFDDSIRQSGQEVCQRRGRKCTTGNQNSTEDPRSFGLCTVLRYNFEWKRSQFFRASRSSTKVECVHPVHKTMVTGKSWVRMNYLTGTLMCVCVCVCVCVCPYEIVCTL